MFKIPLIIKGYHCDAYGHVNNARYLEFFEDCRWQYLQPALENGTFAELGLLFVVVRIDISYKLPLVPLDKVDVTVQAVQYSGMSITFRQSILRNDEVCTEADVKFVLLHKDNQKPVPITDKLKTIFNSLLNQKNVG